MDVRRTMSRTVSVGVLTMVLTLGGCTPWDGGEDFKGVLTLRGAKKETKHCFREWFFDWDPVTISKVPEATQHGYEEGVIRIFCGEHDSSMDTWYLELVFVNLDGGEQQWVGDLSMDDSADIWWEAFYNPYSYFGSATYGPTETPGTYHAGPGMFAHYPEVVEDSYGEVDIQFAGRRGTVSIDNMGWVDGFNEPRPDGEPLHINFVW